MDTNLLLNDIGAALNGSTREEAAQEEAPEASHLVPGDGDGDGASGGLYNLRSAEVTAYLHSFRDHPCSAGRLMMVVLNDKISATEVAKDFVRCCSSWRRAAVALVVSGQGCDLYRPASDAFEQLFDKKLHTRVRSYPDALDMLDVRFGLETPIIVVGFGCLGRYLSLRSGCRVMTHVITRR